jgi:membrane protein implicated in regulation of membrane protease activity
MLEITPDTGNQSGRLTARDRRNARLWQLAPWLELVTVSISPPVALLLAYLITGATSPALLLLAGLSFPFSLITALIIALVTILFRRQWLTNLRDRLASDGITADEVGFFLPELTGGERRVLRAMEKQQPLLADAYRETLALRLNATRLTASARRDLLEVERRINRARYLNAPDTAVLIEELSRDRNRLETLKQEGASRRAEAEARLQMIEAASSRGASWAETNYMLQRLNEGRKHVPLGLESIRAKQEVLQDAERELREDSTQKQSP